MNKRNSVRYGSELIPGNLSKVTISWQGKTLLGSYAANYCAHGIGVLIPPMLNPPEIPKEEETVKVLMPIDPMWFTGICMYVRNESDGSVSLGIYFSEPKEQVYLKDLLFDSLNVPSDLNSFVSYEWEELVGKLCNSDDPRLKEIGHHHLAILKTKQEDSRTA
jgi:hypothetical protein